MGRGGARVGAGRKPKSPVKLEVLEGGLPDGEAMSAEAPADLPESWRVHWSRWAPLAIERRTLTTHTEPQFRLLCRVESDIARTDATIEKDGQTYLKAWVDSSGQEHEELKQHPLLSHYRSLLKQAQNLYEKFMLGPFGKPVAAPVKSRTDRQRDARRASFFGVKRA